MHARGVSGVAVVGRRGDLAGHLGASDVRMLAPGLFHELLSPLRDFLAHLPRSASGGGAQGTSAGRVLCAQPTSSLGSLVGALVRQRVHRIYISDSDGAPVGVVTCTDVLGLLRQVHGRA
jgi:CBS-domain-containing membrane protein